MAFVTKSGQCASPIDQSANIPHLASHGVTHDDDDEHGVAYIVDVKKRVICTSMSTMNRQFHHPIEYKPQATAKVAPVSTRAERERALQNDLGLDDLADNDDHHDSGSRSHSRHSHTDSHSLSRRSHNSGNNDDDSDITSQATIDSFDSYPPTHRSVLDMDTDIEGNDVESIERLVEQCAAAKEAQLRAEEAVRRSEERLEDLQRLSKQAKQLVVKQCKDQLVSLQSQLDEYQSMLSDDDKTIERLRLSNAKLIDGDDEEAIRSAQADIKQSTDCRLLTRENIALQSQVQLLTKQLESLKEQNSINTAESTSALKEATHRTIEAEKRASVIATTIPLQSLQLMTENTMKEKLNKLENRNTKLMNKVNELNKKLKDQEQISPISTTAVVVPLNNNTEIYIAKAVADAEQIKQLSQTIEVLTNELTTVKATAAAATAAAAAVTSSSASSTSSSMAAATALTQSSILQLTNNNIRLETDKKDLQANIIIFEDIIKRRDDEIKLIKEKAKNKLSTASDAIKKLKEEYSKLRNNLIKTRNDYNEISLNNQKTLLLQQQNNKQRQTLRLMSDTIESLRTELLAIRSSALQWNNIVSFIQPLIQRTFTTLLEKQKDGIAAMTAAYRKEVAARRAIYNELCELRGNIRVYCRVRPLTTRESDTTTAINAVTYTDDNTLTINNLEKKTLNPFSFERVFQPNSTQIEVFDQVSDTVTSVMDGYNVCIFAYGQTGTGKTYTMQGSSAEPGVNIRALSSLFTVAEQRHDDMTYTMTMSLIEIYNERIQDLLSGNGTALKCIQGNNGMEIIDLTYTSVSNTAEVLAALTSGSKNRRVTATAMNADSSRSHLILSVYVVGRSKIYGGKEIVGKLHLIDLAGSERISRSGVTGDALKEAQCINSSLSALGNVIAARASKNAHVPFRDSALTWVLQDSLSSNSKTLMFVQVSPANTDVSESICSLRFAERVKKVELGKATANVSKGAKT